jgi:hypothetical protein
MTATYRYRGNVGTGRDDHSTDEGYQQMISSITSIEKDKDEVPQTMYA